MGIVWEDYHKGVQLLGIPGITLELVFGGLLHASQRLVRHSHVGCTHTYFFQIERLVFVGSLILVCTSSLTQNPYP